MPGCRADFSGSRKRGFGRVSFWSSLLAALHVGNGIAAGLPGRDAVVVTPGQEGLVGDADAASQGTIDDEQIENRPLSRPGEVLEVIPGVVVTQHSGSGKANQYFLRGFNLDHGTDFAVHIDGMPVNLPSHGHGQGYADINFLIPELVEHIHYRKGPYYADEGDFSAAGAAHVHLKRSLDGTALDVTPGSYGYRRTLLSSGRAFAGGSLLGVLEIGQDDGPWVNPEKLRKLNGLLRYAQGDERNGFTLTAMGYSSQWNSTDQIPLRAVSDGSIPRFAAVDPTDGGRTSRYSLSTQWIRSDEAGSTRVSAYVIRSDLRLFSNFTFFLNDPVNGDQIEQVDKRTVSGGEVSHLWKTQFSGREIEHTAGLRLRNDDIGQVGLFNTVARQQIGTVRNDSVLQTSAGLYYSASIPWTSWLRANLGLRGDFYRFQVNSDNPANSGKAGDSLLSPKLGLVFGPWSNVEYYANYGHGFHSNDARGATITVDPVTGAPAERVTPLARAIGSELGLRAAPFKGFQTSLALWRLDLASELVFAGDAGTTEASRPSRRQGIEWANYYKPFGSVTFDFDLTLSKARFRDVDPAGNFIPGSTDRTLSGGVTFGEKEGWSGGLRLRYFGPRALIEDNSQKSGSSTLVNAQLGYAVSKQAKIKFEVLNLFNRKVDDITYFYTSRLQGEPAAGVDDKHFHPAEPRSLRLSAVLHF
jgi:outer membrane receptor protein involved in Fe transport